MADLPQIMDANLPMSIDSQTVFPWLSLIVLLPAVGALIMPFLPTQESKNSNLKVLMHCFTGTKEFAKKLVDLNFSISVSGIITFKKADELAVTISSIPIENLLVETDSPYLAPIPYRGKGNEPSYIIHTIKKLSEIKKLSNESIIFNTTNNFMKLFNLS